jgi:hypothetical protein
LMLPRWHQGVHHVAPRPHGAGTGATRATSRTGPSPARSTMMAPRAEVAPGPAERTESPSEQFEEHVSSSGGSPERAGER